MMRLSVKRLDGNVDELQIGPITQLLGMNDVAKNYIVDSLTKHFSKHRYSDEEEAQAGNVLMDNEEVGRGYFITSIVRTMEDLDDLLINSKTGMLATYLDCSLADIDVSYALHRLNDELLKLSDELRGFIQLDRLEVDVEAVEYEIKSLLKNQLRLKLTDENDTPLYQVASDNKLETYIELLMKLDRYDPKRRLMIIHNVDHMLSCDAYREFVTFISECVKEHDFIFVLTVSEEGYVAISKETIPYINVINDIIFNVDSYEQLKNFIINHYPYHKEIDDDELQRLLMPIIHKIGREDHLLEIESQVILKMLNASENMMSKPIKAPNLLALEYVQDE